VKRPDRQGRPGEGSFRNAVRKLDDQCVPAITKRFQGCLTGKFGMRLHQEAVNGPSAIAQRIEKRGQDREGLSHRIDLPGRIARFSW